MLYHFGKLAYKQEDTGDLKLTFTMDDLDECISPELFNCGFMYKSHPLHRFEDCQVGFIHKSVQEYMAAYYISHEATGQAMERLLKEFITDKRFIQVGPVLKFAIYCGLSKEQIQQVIHYCIYNDNDSFNISFALLKLLEQYSLPLHDEPVFLGPENNGYNCFEQLPACMIYTKLSESTFRSRWRGIKQSDDQKSWILTWPSGTKNIIIIDHLSVGKIDVHPGDDGIYIWYLHKWPLLINGEYKGKNTIKLITNGNTHITKVCENVTKVDLQYSKLHLQTKWINNLLFKVPNCTELNMKSCGLSAEDIKHLCEETKGRDLNIEILNLQNNDVITEGADVLVRFVRQCPRLRKLYLTSGNMKKTQHKDLLIQLQERIGGGLLLHIDSHDNDNCWGCGDGGDKGDDKEDSDDDEVATTGAVGGEEESSNTENSDIRKDKCGNRETTVRDQEKEIKRRRKDVF